MGWEEREKNDANKTKRKYCLLHTPIETKPYPAELFVSCCYEMRAFAITQRLSSTWPTEKSPTPQNLQKVKKNATKPVLVWGLGEAKPKRWNKGSRSFPPEGSVRNQSGWDRSMTTHSHKTRKWILIHRWRRKRSRLRQDRPCNADMVI